MSFGEWIEDHLNSMKTFIFSIIVIYISFYYYDLHFGVKKGMHENIGFTRTLDDGDSLITTLYGTPNGYGYETDLGLPDAGGKTHDRVVWFDINPATNKPTNTMNYVAVRAYNNAPTSFFPNHGLTRYDKFAGYLSIVPYDDYYDKKWQEVQNTMTFSFIIVMESFYIRLQ